MKQVHHKSPFTSASGNLPVELLHSISTDATTKGAVSGIKRGRAFELGVPGDKIFNKIISNFGRSIQALNLKVDRARP